MIEAGKKYNSLTAVEFVERRNGKPYWLFKCDCGKEKVIVAGNVTNGHVKSCGCLNSRQAKINGRKTFKDLTGQRFGKLVALSYDQDKKKWLCQCDCGNTCYVAQSNLCRKTQKATKSCGCALSLEAANAVNIVDGTNAGNVINRTALSNSRSGVRGVCFSPARGMYIASITFQGKTYYLGASTDFEYLCKVRKEAENKVYGNFIEWYMKEIKGIKPEDKE